MRLVLVDRLTDRRRRFEPVAASRPVWELWVGMGSLLDKLLAMFVPDYLAGAYGEQVDWPVNDLATLKGEDLLIVEATVRADRLDMGLIRGPSLILCDDAGEVVCGYLAAGDAAGLPADTLESFLATASEAFGGDGAVPERWSAVWELMEANGDQITADFTAAGRRGVACSPEQPFALRGSEENVYVAPDVSIHPMVVLDATGGPIVIESGAEIQPFTRIEGPCYIGRDSVLLGAKCRAGTTIGPVCRMGGEIEASVVLGYSNKYHDGFLGHAYVGQWVNLGALTSNSDLKNDYSDVSVILEGVEAVDTGSKKTGAMIGDHVRTSIGTLLNTGATVGGMSMLLAMGRPLPKFLPPFSWFIKGQLPEDPVRERLYKAAATAMARRGMEFTAAQRAMWDAVYDLSASQRKAAITRLAATS
jgi:UDP-N-acetylglucosamine diphosphorylase/glucosamine-1-phosphate N-acetyltransferase